MDILDAYHIALAAYSSQQVSNEGHSSDIYDFLNEETEPIWESLSNAQQTELEDFARKNVDLFDSFPSSYQNDEDMELREEVIETIQEKLSSTFSYIE